MNPDSLELVGSTGRIVLSYNSKIANIVADFPTPVIVESYLDSQLSNEFVVSDSELYVAATAEDYEVHRLELNITSPGFRIYTFTFG